MLKNNLNLTRFYSLKLTHFALLMSLVNLLFFHFPFYKFVFNNIDYKSLNGTLVIISLVVLMVVANAFTF